MNKVTQTASVTQARNMQLPAAVQWPPQPVMSFCSVLHTRLAGRAIPCLCCIAHVCKARGSGPHSPSSGRTAQSSAQPVPPAFFSVRHTCLEGAGQWPPQRIPSSSRTAKSSAQPLPPARQFRPIAAHTLSPQLGSFGRATNKETALLLLFRGG